DVSLHLDHPTRRRKLSLRPLQPGAHREPLELLGARPARPAFSRLQAPQRTRVLLLAPRRQMRRVQALTAQHHRDLTRPRRPGRLTQDPQLVLAGEPPTPRTLSKLRVRPGPPSRHGMRARHFAALAYGSLHETPGARRLLHLHTQHGLQHHYSSVLALKAQQSNSKTCLTSPWQRGERQINCVSGFLGLV